MSNLTEIFGETIHTYTRAEAIADGVLVEVSPELAREAGLKLPVAMTSAVWEDCVAWTEADNDRKGTLQDEGGRLWDVLVMTRWAAGRARGTDRVVVELRRVPRAGKGRIARKVQLDAHLGAGDNGEGVLTLMQPGES